MHAEKNINPHYDYEVSRGSGTGSLTSLGVRYRTLSQSYEDCLGVLVSDCCFGISPVNLVRQVSPQNRFFSDGSVNYMYPDPEYITMGIYWIISLSFREILFCEYEIFVYYAPGTL